jgi:transposase
MSEVAFRFFVGIDWATEVHDICLIDSAGKEIGKRRVEHTGEAIGKLVAWLLRVCDGDAGSVAVGIEVPRGAVVESLVERGFAVFSVNPKQMDRFRDRFSVAGSKDDTLDALVLADSLRTDGHCFRRVRLDDPIVIRLRELSRIEDEVGQDLNRLCNQLREVLLRYFPQVLTLGPAADEAWIWDLLEIAPSPREAGSVSARKVQKVLQKNRIRRVSSEEVLEVLRREPLRVAPGVMEAASEHIGMLLPRLRLLRSLRADCARRTEQMIEEMEASQSEPSEHRDVAILLSLPGVGRVILATMLAEASQPLAERDYHALRAYGGVAPVTRGSGKRSGKKALVLMRRSCNSRLRNAFYHWARVATQHDDATRKHYATLRAKGHTHGRALRGVADRLLKMAMAMLRDQTQYDPLRRGHHSSPQTSGSPIEGGYMLLA